MRAFVFVALLGCSSSNFQIAESDDASPAQDTSITNDVTTSDVIASEGMPIDTPPSLDRVCEEGARAACDKLFACAPFLGKRLQKDHSECIALNRKACILNTAQPGTARTEALNAECTKAIPALSCADYLAGRYPAPCMPKAGTLSSGTACRTHDQCATAFCIGGRAEECGRCSAAPSKPGSPCEAEQCGFGLACALGTCRSLGALGNMCGDSDPCSPELYCAAGKCAKRPGVGEACDDKRPCDSIFVGNYCDTTLGQCKAFALADPGKPCGVLASGTTLCAAGGFCRISALMSGLCVAAAKEGEMCSTKLGPQCIGGAYCGTDGTCKPPLVCGG